MSTTIVIEILLGIVLAVYAGIAVRAYVRMRGKRIVVCPETSQPAAVEVDAAHAAVSALWEKADVQLCGCSRWPERHDCDQACTSQIRVAPEDTRVVTMLKRWYAGKNCAICKRAIAPLHRMEPKPGLLNVASHEVLTWEDVPAEQLPQMLDSHLPVCANCQVAETFRRQFPDLALDRPEHGDKPGINVH